MNNLDQMDVNKNKACTVSVCHCNSACEFQYLEVQVKNLASKYGDLQPFAPIQLDDFWGYLSRRCFVSKLIQSRHFSISNVILPRFNNEHEDIK